MMAFPKDNFPSKPKNAEKGGRQERTGNPYFSKPTNGRTEETQFRNRRGDYGKKPQPTGVEEGGMPAFPRFIHG